jgi:hypothetical protein
LKKNGGSAFFVRNFMTSQNESRCINSISQGSINLFSREIVATPIKGPSGSSVSLIESSICPSLGTAMKVKQLLIGVGETYQICV